jgi:nucleoside-diphosphate-sugar epimerase
MRKFALFGAAGAIGNSIAAALREMQQPYRVVGRSRDTLQRDFGFDPLAEIVTWNPDDPASVIAAAQDIDVIIYLVGVAYDHFELHPQLMRKTLDGAIAAGVTRMLLISTFYPYGLAQTNPVREDRPLQRPDTQGAGRPAARRQRRRQDSRRSAAAA